MLRFAIRLQSTPIIQNVLAPDGSL